MSLAERLRRVPPLGWVVLFAVLMTLPGLWSFGFWDPWELSIADRARALLRAGDLLDTTVAGKYAAEPPLDLFLSAAGMKIFGARELGARLFNALAGIGALLGVYWAGLGLFRRRAALLSALVLGSMPLFVLQARQLTSDMPLVAGLALSLGGLGRYAWPASGQRQLRNLLLAAVGLALGALSGGALLGVALPCLALTGALVTGFGLRPGKVEDKADESDISSALSPGGVGPDVPTDKTFGAGLFSKGVKGRGALLLVAVVGIAVLLLTLTTANIAGRYSVLLGGVPRGGTPSQMFEFIVKQLGFGLFPWSALVVFALGRALIHAGDDQDRGGRLGFLQLYLLVFAAFGFGLTTLFVLMTGDARFAPLAPLALAVGVFLDEALDGERAEPVLGLLVATGTMVVARDFFLGPEELVSMHLLAKVKWPPTLSVGYGVLVVGLLAGGGIYAGLATRGRALGRIAPRDLGDAGPLKRRLEALAVEAGRWGIHVAVAVAIVFSALLAHVLVPNLSQHFSFKPVLESYSRFAKEGEEIGKYHVEGHGTSFYGASDMVEIPTQDRLVEFLKRPKRAFALVGADDLASLDAALKLVQVDYVVVDASSSRFLLLSNQLGAGEADHNPIKKNVWMAPRPPERITTQAAEGTVPERGGNAIKYNWHGQIPPWGEPSIKVNAVFANSIELLGADLPSSIRRPGKIPLTLYFRVLTRPPGAYKVFAHFDAPGEPRLLGDHVPVDGTFATGNWLPGEYIRDQYDVDVPLMTTPAGTYTVLVGFWPGGEQKRLAITAGTSNDGVDRARVGTIEIR